MTDKLFSKTHGVAVSAGSLVVSPPVRSGHRIQAGDEVWIDSHEGTIFPRSAFGKGSCKYKQVGTGNSYYTIYGCQGAVELKNGNIVSIFSCKYGSNVYSLYLVIQSPDGRELYKQPNNAAGLIGDSGAYFLSALDDDKTLILTSYSGIVKIILEDDYSGIRTVVTIASGTQFEFILESDVSYYFVRKDTGALVEVKKADGELTSKGSALTAHGYLGYSSLANKPTTDGLFFYQDSTTNLIKMLDVTTGSYVASIAAPNNSHAHGVCKLSDNVAVFVFTGGATVIYFSVTWENGSLTGTSYTSDISGGGFGVSVRVYYNELQQKICVTGRKGYSSDLSVFLASAKYNSGDGKIDGFTFESASPGLSSTYFRTDGFKNIHSLRIGNIANFGTSTNGTAMSLSAFSKMDFSSAHVSRLGTALNDSEVIVSEPVQAIPAQGLPVTGYAAVNDELMLKVAGESYSGDCSTNASPGVLSGSLGGNYFPLYTHKKPGGMRPVDLSCFNNHSTSISYQTSIVAAFDGFYVNFGLSNQRLKGVLVTFNYLSNIMVSTYVNNLSTPQMYGIHPGAYK